VATRSKPAEPATETPEPETIDFSSMTLAQRLTKARDLLSGGVEKKGKNTAQDYAYVKAGDVSRAVYDALARVGVYAIPSYSEVPEQPLTTWASRGGTPQFMARIRVTLRVGRVEDKMGFSITSSQTPETLIVETVGYGADSGDKGPYKAMTGGLKYALLHLLGLATDDDPEATTAADREPAAPVERQVGRAPSTAGEPAAVTTVVGDNPEAPITSKQSALIFAKANEAGLDQTQFRSLVFMVTSKRSSKQLVSKDVDDILAGLKDEALLERAKAGAEQDVAFDTTVGQAPDPTKDAGAEADRIAAEAAALTGGEVVDGAE
jgi:hypothetical protein